MVTELNNEKPGGAPEPPVTLEPRQLLESPAVQGIIESVEALFPAVRIWFRSPDGQRSPVRASSDPYCDAFKDLSEDQRRSIPSGDSIPDSTPREEIPLVRDCCPGRCRALAPMRLRGVRLGTIGICGADGETVRHVARIVNGALRILSNVLEDNDDLELIYRMWDEIGAVSEVTPVLLSCLDRVLAASGVNVGAIFLFNEEGSAEYQEERGLDAERAAAAPLELSREDFEGLIEGRTALSVKVPGNHPLRTWANAVDESRDSQGHLFVMPFFHGRGVQGFVLLFPAWSFTGEKKRPALQLMLEGMGSAIHNLLALEGERNRAQAVNVIHAIHRLVSMSEGKEDFLPRVCQLLADTFHVEKCGVMLWNQARQVLEPAAGVGMDEGEIGTEPLAMNEGLIGRAGASFEARQLTRAKGMEGSPGGVSQGYYAQSYLSIPLIGEDLVGVMTLGTDRREFTNADRRMGFILGEQIVVSLRLLEMPKEIT